MMSKLYPIMETFSTIQGEGHFTGTPAFFIRIAGCDIGCSWCDVKESWDTDNVDKHSVSDLVSQAVSSTISLVVITGGEPCIYDLEPLTTALHEAGLTVHIETSGAYPIIGSFDWITLSPKKFKACIPSSFQVADELKVVVVNSHDLKWAVEKSEHIPEKTLKFLQPEWDKRDKMLPQILDFLQSTDGSKWRLSVQTHKYLGLR